MPNQLNSDPWLCSELPLDVLTLDLSSSPNSTNLYGSNHEQPVHLILHVSITCEQNPKNLKLIFLWQQLTPNLECQSAVFRQSLWSSDLEVLTLVPLVSCSAANQCWRWQNEEAGEPLHLQKAGRQIWHSHTRHNAHPSYALRSCPLVSQNGFEISVKFGRAH